MSKTYHTKYTSSVNPILLFVSILSIVSIGIILAGTLLYGPSLGNTDTIQAEFETFYSSDDESSINITYYYNETSLSDLYYKVKDSIVEISGLVSYSSFWTTIYGEVQGSGFVYEYNNEMYIITNNHVVEDAENLVVTFSNGNGYPAELIASDAYVDLALLTVDAAGEEFQPIDIVSSSNIEVGDPVFAIGSPLGLDGTMTTGIVSQLHRTLEESAAGSFPIANIIQTSVAINPGNSGGPLLNYRGDVIGITTAIIEDSEGLGFAVPSDTLIKEIPELIATGEYLDHSWLGISGVDMSYSLSIELGVNVTYGWLIGQVTENSAANTAGILGGTDIIVHYGEQIIVGGDIIIDIDGQRLINGDYLMSYLEAYTVPGQQVTLTIIRDNQEIDIVVTLGQRPLLQ